MKALLAALLLVSLTACPGKPPAPVPPQEESPTGSEPAPERRRFELADHHLVLPGPLEFDGIVLDVDASTEALTHIRDFLLERTDVTVVRLEGHTASDQNTGDGLVFSGERARSVGLWLVSEGVACERLLVAAFAGFKPIASNDTPEGMAQNRRIEVVVAELRGRAIDGMPVDGGKLADGGPALAISVCELTND